MSRATVGIDDVSACSGSLAKVRVQLWPIASHPYLCVYGCAYLQLKVHADNIRLANKKEKNSIIVIAVVK